MSENKPPKVIIIGAGCTGKIALMNKAIKDADAKGTSVLIVSPPEEPKDPWGLPSKPLLVKNELAHLRFALNAKLGSLAKPKKRKKRHKQKRRK